MDQCYVAYDSLNESSFTSWFNAKNQIFLNQTQKFTKLFQASSVAIKTKITTYINMISYKKKNAQSYDRNIHNQISNRRYDFKTKD